jgi:calmodulin
LSSWEEVATVIRALGKNPTNAEVQQLLEEQGQGSRVDVDFEKFKAIYNSKMPKPDDQRDAMSSAFQAMDADGTGMLREGELRQALQNYGEAIDSQEVDMLMRRVHVGPSGDIQYSKLIDLLIAEQ